MGSTLTFGDVTLSADDLTLVQPPNWLNDNLLTFWGQYLVGKLMSDGERLPGEVVFVPPNLSFFLSLCEDEEDVKNAISALGMTDAKVVLVPVNDSQDADAKKTSGTHWTLLAWLGDIGQFVLLDSAGVRKSRRVASKLAMHLRPYIASAVIQGVDEDLQVCRTPRQKNNWDCGSYCCVFMDFLARLKGCTSVEDLEYRLRALRFDNFRSDLASTIVDLAKKL
mmetsp:Transcript_42063/g.103479  ORF Transcript_42063/g.103479 Transcript_42063/m.103479 type:complete len:223 (-) Transcript_42063:311-979(-)